MTAEYVTGKIEIEFYNHFGTWFKHMQSSNFVEMLVIHCSITLHEIWLKVLKKLNKSSDIEQQSPFGDRK